jgi:hypothetical protein
LFGGEVDAKECDSGDADLVEAHDGPWALDEDDQIGVERSDAVEVVEQAVLGETWGELPFPVVSDLLWIESSCGIAEGFSVGVVEADADSVLEEASAAIETGLEAACSLRTDALLAQEIGFRVEWEVAAEGSEGPGGQVDLLPGGEGLVGLAGKGAEVVGYLGVGALVESSDELDDVATGVTSGEASPEILAPRDHESP